MKKKLLVSLLSVVMVVTMMPLSIFANTAEEATKTEVKAESETATEANASNKDLAKQEFGVPDSNVVESTATNVLALENDLAVAKDKAAASGKWAMVYANKNLSVDQYFSIPAQVVLCAADATQFSFQSDRRIYLEGAVFGGTYEGKNGGQMGIVLAQEYSGKNGTVKYCTFQNFGSNGVWVTHGNGGKIIHNKITKNGVNGIRIQDDGNLSRVEDNEISYSKDQSGIDIDTIYKDQVTKVDYIIGNNIHHNNGHGISTNTQDDRHVTIPGASCQMIQVDNNTFAYNGHEAGNQGVWMEDNCKITKSFNGNKIYGNVGNGLALDSGAEVNGMANCDIYGNGSSNVSVYSETTQLTKLYMTSGNKIHAAKNGPEIATAGRAAVRMTGSGNECYYAPEGSNEIYLADSSSLIVTGGLVITPKYNEHPTISFNKVSTVELHNTTIKANSSGWYSVYYDKTCSFYRSNCTIQGKTYVKQDVAGLPTVGSFSSKAADSKTCSLSWSKASNSTATANKYLVYRGTSSTGSWPCIATTTSTSYIDKSVTSGTKYYYMVKPAFASGEDFVYGSYSSKDYAYPRINALTGFRVWASDYKTANISWNKCLDKDAEFWIYRGTKPTGDWGPVYAKVTKNEATSWSETVKPGTKYYYMVREAVKGNDGKYYFGPYTNVDYAYPRLSAPTGFSAWAGVSHTCKCSWNPIKSAEGVTDIQYLVYMSEKPSGNWGNAVAVLDSKTTSYTRTNLKSGKKYYFMVRAKAKIDGVYYFSDYTNVDYGYPR